MTADGAKFPKIALEEHVVLPSQIPYLKSSNSLQEKREFLIDTEDARLKSMDECNIRVSILSAFSDGVQDMPPCPFSKQIYYIYFILNQK